MKDGLPEFILTMSLIVIIIVQGFALAHLDTKVKELQEEAYRRGHAEFAGEPLEWQWKQQQE